MAPDIASIKSFGEVSFEPHQQTFSLEKTAAYKLGAEFPDVLHSPMAWKGEDFADQSSYVYKLEQTEILELENALRYFQSLGLDGGDVGRDNFPLPNLQHRLMLCTLDIHNGKGFFILRGLNPHLYTPEENLILFLGISSYIGDVRGRQDSKGNMICHITDSKLSTVSPDKRHGIHSTKGLPFHSDMICDILALHTRQRAVNGGLRYLASSWTVYNELAESRPDIIRALCEPNWPVFTPGKKPSFTLCPILVFSDGKIILSLDPGRLGPHPADDGTVPVLTPEQTEALHTVQAVAQKHQIQIAPEAGDLHYFNNLSIIHSRAPYEDGDKSARHIVRLWLHNSKLGWKLPEALMEPWEAAFGNSEAYEKKYCVVPLPIYKPPRYAVGSGSFITDGERPDSDSE